MYTGAARTKLDDILYGKEQIKFCKESQRVPRKV